MSSNDTTVPDTLNDAQWVQRPPILAVRDHPQVLSAPDEKCWVNWKLEPTKDGKWTKRPYTTKGSLASSTDPMTWSTFNEVYAARNDFDGIGFVFTGTTLGIDLDKVLVRGDVAPEEMAVIEKAQTYTETSPSGKGLHLYLQLTEPLKLEAHKYTFKDGTERVYECYTSGRYFTSTGQPWTTSYPIRTVTPEEALEVLKLLGYPWSKKRDREREAVTATLNTIAPKTLTLDDESLLKKMFGSANGEKIRALYNGDISAYGGDDSAADAALCTHLAFWTNKDPERTTSLWLASPLGSRQKTQGREDYQKITVNFAIENCTDTYKPSSSHSSRETVDTQDFQQVLSPSLTVISDTELMALNIPSVEWQIKSLFAKGTLNMISAPPNQYKSWLVLRMAMSVAHGLTLFDEFETTKCNVLYVNEEDNHTENKKRYGMLLHKGEQPGGVFFVIESGRMIDVKWATEIVEIAKARNVGFVILDSLRALHLEKENDSDAMQKVMNSLKILSRNGLTVLFTHHHRKGQNGGSEQSEDEMDKARGSSAIPGAIHGHITCAEKTTGDHYLVVHQPKLKAAKKLDPFMLRITDELEPSGMSFAYAGVYNANMAAVGAMENKLLQRFREHPDTFFTRKSLVDAGFAKSPGDKTLRGGLDALVKKKTIISRAFSVLQEDDQFRVPGDGSNKPNETVYWLSSHILDDSRGEDF